MQQFQLYILPVPKKVVFPYQSLNIRIPDTYDYEPKKFNSLIGLLNQIDENDRSNQIKMIDNFSKYGTILRITSEERTYYTFQRDIHRSQREIKYYGALAFGRFKVVNFKQTSPFYLANVELLADEIPQQIEQQITNSGLISQLKEQCLIYLDIIMKSEQSQAKKRQVEEENSINKLVFTICGLIDSGLNEKLQLLQIDDLKKRIEFLLKIISQKNSQMKGAQELENKVRSEMTKPIQPLVTRKLQDQFSIGDSGESDLQQLEKKIKEANLPEQVLSEIVKEFKRLKSMRMSNNAESNQIRNYIDTVLELPWNFQTEDNHDLTRAEEILDRDHHGLQIVKKRILEFLAVKALNGNAKGSIICLAGPPGVGKTSLGKSIAESLGRKFDRISLGGVRDEAQVRGHRRTYVGSMPGVFINSLKKLKSKNPVILLDEIDKISHSDFRGDPSSALLELLDPNQNNSFVDHYLNLPFDFSNVIFIATANSLDNLQPALYDRLEIIRIPGYTNYEKKDIALKYLIPKQIQENGLTGNIIEISKEAIDLIITGYTKEAGVRSLERNIGAVCRNVAVRYSKFKKNQTTSKEFPKVTINEDDVKEVLGVVIYDADEVKERIERPGIATGMAWTEVGGKLLFIESSISRGKGRVQITGKAGEVMQESVKTSIAWIRTNAEKILGRESQEHYLDKYDLNIHFPEAAIPKDGPSAGVTITTSIISLLTRIKVRSDVSMTGEISLKGVVLPVGGIKEKCLAAFQGGIRRIILPKKNQKDIAEISQEIKDQIEFVFVKRLEDVIDNALEPGEELEKLRQKFKSHQIIKLSKL